MLLAEQYSRCFKLKKMKGKKIILLVDPFVHMSHACNIHLAEFEVKRSS